MLAFKYFSAASVLIPFFIGLFLLRKAESVMKSFFGFIVFSVLFEAVNDYFGIVYNDNQWLFKIFLICDFVYFVWFYHVAFKKPLWDLRISIFPFALIFISEFLADKFAGLNQYVSWFHLVVFVFFIIQSSYAIIKSFEYYENNIFKFPVFWISFSRLLYFFLIVFIFVYPKLIYLGKDYKLIDYMNGFIVAFANICLNLLYTVAFLCLRKKN